MIRQLFLFLFKIEHLPILFPATISTWETESRVNVRWLFQHCEAFSFHLYYFSFFRTVCLTDLWKEAGLNDECVVFLLNICQSCVICNSWFSNKRWQGNEWVGLCWLWLCEVAPPLSLYPTLQRLPVIRFLVTNPAPRGWRQSTKFL